jgi:hypothetical protein
MQKVIQDYKTPGHATAFSGLNAMTRFYRGQYSKAQLSRAMEGVDAYTIKRESKPVSVFNPIYTHRPREIVQADLVDVQALSKLKKRNMKKRYLLCVIDSYTRKAWIEATEDKKETTIRDAFARILQQLKPKMRSSGFVLLVDRGTEFVNRLFGRFLRANNIELRHPSFKASHVERFQKSIQALIYRYIENKQSNSYLPALPALLHTYNTRYHRTIKMSPNEAEEEKNADRLLRNVTDEYARRKRRKPRFSRGELVRVLKKKGSFARSYDDTYGEPHFRIAEIFTRMPIPQYAVEDLRGVRRRGRLYAEQMQRVHNPDSIYKVEKIIKRRTRRRVKQALVRWLGYGPEFDTWLPETDVADHFERDEASTTGSSSSSEEEEEA